MAPKKMTDAEKAKLKKMLMQGGKINLDKAAKERAFERARAADKKAKAKAAGKATAAKTKPKSKSLVSKVVGRAKTVAREVRDIPTAAANVYKSRNMPEGGVAKFAKKDLKIQIKEAGKAIVTGKKGTEAAQETAKYSTKGRVGGGGLDYYISKPKKPRK